MSAGAKESTLIEGTIGGFVETTFTEGIVLEVGGTKGVLRVDLQEKEIAQEAKSLNSQKTA